MTQVYLNPVPSNRSTSGRDSESDLRDNCDMTTARTSFAKLNVVVTGGGGALGGAVVEQLLEHGARVHVPCIGAVPEAFADRERLLATANVNLTDDESAAAFFATTGPLWGSVHLAGTFAMGTIETTTTAMFRKLMEINAVTCLISCREAVAKIRAADSGGRIVNVAARPVSVPTPGMTAYAASKAAVATITATLAEELAPEGIWVNAIAPSIIDTPANRAAMPDANYSNWPTPADLAQTILHLVSPDNASTRGAIVPVYGRS